MKAVAYWISNAPGKDRQPLVLPDGVTVYIRAVIAEGVACLSDALGAGHDTSAKGDDESQMNSHWHPESEKEAIEIEPW